MDTPSNIATIIQLALDYSNNQYKDNTFLKLEKVVEVIRWEQTRNTAYGSAIIKVKHRKQRLHITIGCLRDLLDKELHPRLRSDISRQPLVVISNWEG